MENKGYLFAELSVSDPDVFYDHYMPKVGPILEKFGAKFLVGTNSPQIVEGGRNVSRVIFIEFSSVDTAREFYFSPEYQDIVDFRFRSSTAHLYILDGI